MSRVPQRADAVRKFLSTFDLRTLELDLAALQREWESLSQPQSLLPPSEDYLRLEDIFGGGGGHVRAGDRAHVVEVTNSETLNECITCCKAVSLCARRPPPERS